MVSLTTRSFDGDIVPEYNPDEASHVIVEPGKSVSKARVTKNIMLVYTIKLASDLRQVSGFLRVLQFPPPIKLTVTI
jgi:hypothetical protein